LLEAQRLRRAKVGDASNDVAAVADALGDLALALGSGPDALEQFNRALATHQKIGNTVATGSDLVGLGRAALLLNQPVLAVQALERALSTHAPTEDPKALAVVKLELGRALWVSGAESQPRARVLLGEALAAMVEPARGEAKAALARRGIVVSVADGG
jgi:hypothetical protein